MVTHTFCSSMYTCVGPDYRWLLLGFQREFEQSDALRLFEILSCDHLELISQQVDRARYQERLAQKINTGESQVGICGKIVTSVTLCNDVCFPLWSFQRRIQSLNYLPSTRTSRSSSSSVQPSCWKTESLCWGAAMKFSSFSLPAGTSVHLKGSLIPEKGLCIDESFVLSLQPAGNTGPEQHTEERRAPFLQLLQALCLGLHDRAL